MSRINCFALHVALLSLVLPRATTAQQSPGLGVITRDFLSASASNDWSWLETLPGFRWAPLPPTSFTNCLANGHCFARQGTVTLDGRSVLAMATGARTIVAALFLRNQGVTLGEQGVMASLEAAGMTAVLARCPVRAGTAATSWYRLTGEGLTAGFLALQPAAPGRPNEGITITRGDELPTLQPNQLALYSETCGDGEPRKAVSTTKPDEAVAEMVIALLVPAGGPTLYDWDALRASTPEINWLRGAPTAADLKSLGDPNPMMLSGNVTLAGRRFSVMATGTANQVRTIHLDEQGLHPRGEHMLGVVYAKGITVRKVRCGPVYTESTNDWYALTSATSRLANIRQSIRYDGSNVQEAYQLRLDATLPPRDPRDRNPGVAGC
jgi:hypothetical protein